MNTRKIARLGDWDEAELTELVTSSVRPSTALLVAT
jgi:hypothetical protein